MLGIFFDPADQRITRLIHPYLGPVIDCFILNCGLLRSFLCIWWSWEINGFSSMSPAGITSVLMRGSKESVCLRRRVLKTPVFIHRHTQGVTEGPSICGQYWLSSSIYFSWKRVWINGANWGFDRTKKTEWFMSHIIHWVILMFQLERPSGSEVCKHLLLVFHSTLSGELYSISAITCFWPWFQRSETFTSSTPKVLPQPLRH